MAQELSVSNKIKLKMIAYLKNCYAFSDEVAAGLFEKFEINLRQCHQSILAAVKDGDLAAVKSGLHALKGILMNGGLNEEGDLAGRLETKLADNAPLDALEGEIKTLFSRMMDTLDLADRKRVLIVDDMDFVREFVKKSLQKLFPTIVTTEAGTGQAALDVLQSETFDLVVCDWELPGASGVDILKQMRDTARTKSTPFMMLTANGDRDHVMQALQLGANDYLVKPVKLDTLATKVRKLVFPNG
ncbi:MAG TPA: response regulator [Bdellovibrionota bacterium]|nr:response regulator [Bdellovibrionota bacterium]